MGNNPKNSTAARKRREQKKKRFHVRKRRMCPVCGNVTNKARCVVCGWMFPRRSC